MWTSLIAASVLGVLVGASGPRRLPSYLTPCVKDSPNFDACCLEQARKAIPFIADGEKRYGIPTLKPLKLEKVDVNTGNFKITLTDISLWGLAETDIKNFKFDLKNKQIAVDFKCPQIMILGKYNMDGKLVLNINGNGQANITIDEPHFNIKTSYKFIEKDGLEYIQLNDDAEINYVLSNAHLDFTNLFNGNEQLAKSTLEVLNREWQPIVKELKPAIDSTVRSVSAVILNGMASRVPYKNLFA